MVQAYKSPRGQETRAIITSAATGQASAELVGAIFDLISSLRRGPAGTSASGPLLVRLASEGPMRSCDLALDLGLDQSTVSRHVATLESEGLVRRQPQADDRRAHLVEVTPLGADTARTRVATRVGHFEASIAEWPEEDVRTLARLLSRFLDGLAVEEPSHA